MIELGWTWREVMETPYDVYQRALIYLRVRTVVQHGGELRFSSEETP